ALRSNSATSRLLPTPDSPPTKTAPAAPSRAPRSAAASASSCSSRPTNAGLETRRPTGPILAATKTFVQLRPQPGRRNGQPPDADGRVLATSSIASTTKEDTMIRPLRHTRLALAGLLALVAIAIAAPAGHAATPACGTTYTGSGGSWWNASDWSNGVPNETTVACIPAW